MQLGEAAERLVGGVVVRLQGSKAVIPLAATDVEYEGRGHMTYLFRKVSCAGTVSRRQLRGSAGGGSWDGAQLGTVWVRSAVLPPSHQFDTPSLATWLMPCR